MAAPAERTIAATSQRKSCGQCLVALLAAELKQPTPATTSQAHNWLATGRMRHRCPRRACVTRRIVVAVPAEQGASSRQTCRGRCLVEHLAG
eukprot:9740489-Alexandrium_andersonii.AAC.1